MSAVGQLWVYLSASPLLWLTITLAAYAAADRLAAFFNRHPIANPVLIAVAIVVALLWATGTKYETYFDGAQFVHFLLGPATVALGLPLFEHRKTVIRSLWPILGALVAGGLTAVVSAVSHRLGDGRAARRHRRARAEIGYGRHCNGYRPRNGRRPVAHCHTGDSDGDPRCNHGHPAYELRLESRTGEPVASQLALPHTASAPRAHFRSTRLLAHLRALRWD